MKAILHAWVQNIALWPQAVNHLHYFITLLFAVPAILGMTIRARSPETRYLLFYLGILIVWPYPDDMSRFLYPVMPFILLNLVVGIQWLTRGNRVRNLKHFLILLFILAAITPSHIKAYERYNLGKSLFGNDVTHIPELYTLQSEKDAASTSLIWHKTAEFMKSLKQVSAGYGMTLTIKPQFLTFYSDIKAETS